MNLVMARLNLEICLVNLNDIIVISAGVDEDRLRAVLERPRNARLKLKPSKCGLFQMSVSFLGHIDSGEGIATDQRKIESVAKWPVIAYLKDIRSFVDLCSYYRRFVKGFAEIASPLHMMTRKGVSYQWSPDCHVAFECLKQALITSPILAIPTDEDRYVLDTDASNHSIGVVLSQIQVGEERMIAYGSQTYKKAKVNYCTTRKELLAVV